MKNVNHKILGCHHVKRIWPELQFLLNSLIRKQTQLRVMQQQSLDNAATEQIRQQLFQ